MIDFSLPRKYRSLIDTTRLEICLNTALTKLSLTQGQAVTLKFTDNAGIQKLNSAYRAVDEPTDVLSFENDYMDLETGLHYLGDIVISIEKAQSQALQNEHPLQQEVEMLFVHGVLHLLGYDHADEAGFAAMSRLQDEILQEVGNPLLGSIAQPL